MKKSCRRTQTAIISTCFPAEYNRFSTRTDFFINLTYELADQIFHVQQKKNDGEYKIQTEHNDYQHKRNIQLESDLVYPYRNLSNTSSSCEKNIMCLIMAGGSLLQTVLTFNGACNNVCK